MANSNDLKIMYIFEAGARLHCGSEVLCLATHIYHRFFRENQLLTQYDMYMFGSACLQLAHWFYEKPIDVNDIALVLNSLQNGLTNKLSEDNRRKLARSIEFTSKVVAIHLDYQINYKDTGIPTPGEVLQRPISVPEIVELRDEYEDEDAITKEERLLAYNCKHTISSHRFLTHYLTCIRLIVPDEFKNNFELICNLSWTYLCDFHWSPHVTRYHSNHLACATLMMAIETYKPNFTEKNLTFWNLINKKWNLIFCDDFDRKKYERLRAVIIRDYQEYDRLLQHEFSTYVIDPKAKHKE